MELYSTIDCARLLGIAEHRIAYAHRSGHLKEPRHSIAGKRVYTQDDLSRLATYFQVSHLFEQLQENGGKNHE